MPKLIVLDLSTYASIEDLRADLPEGAPLFLISAAERLGPPLMEEWANRYSANAYCVPEVETAVRAHAQASLDWQNNNWSEVISSL